MLINSWAQRASWMQNEIVGAVARCAQEMPLNEVSMREIARRSNLSAPGLYQYFRSRAELMRYSAEHAVTVVVEQLADELRNAKEGAARHQVIWAKLVHIARNALGVMR